MKQFKLPKEFAEKWVAALRSGEYKQSYEDYENDGCYCTAGVGYEVNGYQPKGDKLLNFPDKDPLTGKLFHEIVTMNDEQKLPFAEIADWIEENVEFVQ